MSYIIVSRVSQPEARPELVGPRPSNPGRRTSKLSGCSYDTLRSARWGSPAFALLRRPLTCSTIDWAPHLDVHVSDHLYGKVLKRKKSCVVMKRWRTPCRLHADAFGLLQSGQYGSSVFRHRVTHPLILQYRLTRISAGKISLLANILAAA
jgi:hypothetical protein